MAFSASEILSAPQAAASGAQNFFIAEEARADLSEREALLDASFGPARFLKTCEKLRRGRKPAAGLALTARAHDGAFVGSIRLWPIFAGFGRPSLLLGPLAVAEDWRACGVGAALMRVSLARAKALGHGSVLLVGDAPYYAKFGFERRHALGLILPGPVEEERFLGLELRRGALAGAQGFVRPAGARVENESAPTRESARAA